MERAEDGEGEPDSRHLVATAQQAGVLTSWNNHRSNTGGLIESTCVQDGTFLPQMFIFQRTT